MNPILKRWLIHSAEIICIAAVSGIVAALITLVPQIASVLPQQYAVEASVLVPLLLSALRSAQVEIQNEQNAINQGKQ